MKNSAQYASVGDLISDYKSKNKKPSEVIEFYLNKKDHWNCVLTQNSRALDQAKVLDLKLSEIEKYPLFGVPIAIKDNIVIEGMKTTCASKILENYIPPYTATVVQRLEAAGAIVIGKTNMDEFAMGSSNENSAFGAVLHPSHPEAVPGGSSGGSSVAVASDLAMLSLGSDTGGSIRLPASFCGVVGYKPTYGTVSRYGLVAFASSLDQIGPFGKNVFDAALCAEVMSGFDPKDSTSFQNPSLKLTENFKAASFKGKKIGIVKEFIDEKIQKEVFDAFESAKKWIQSEGGEIVEVSMPNLKYSISVYYLIAVSEASSNLARFDGVRYGARPVDLKTNSLADFYSSIRSQFGEEVKRRILLGTYALSSGYFDAYYKRACQVRRLIANDFSRAFQSVDAIMTPTSPTTAFKRGEKSDPLSMYLMDLYTIPANLAGIPGVSVPYSKDKENLPIGIQFLCPQLQDQKLLELAACLERGPNGV